MELKIHLGFKELFNLVTQLPPGEKQKMVSALKEEIEHVSKVKYKIEFGKFRGQISVPDDFNEPLADFKEYM